MFSKFNTLRPRLLVAIVIFVLVTSFVSVIRADSPCGESAPEQQDILSLLVRKDWQESLAKMPDKAMQNIIAKTILGGDGAPSWNMEELSVFGGYPAAVKVDGNVAFTAWGRTLVVLDVSDPYHPFAYGALTLAETIWDMDFMYHPKGRYLILATSSALRVVGIGRLALPVEVGAIHNAVFAHSVAVSGEYAFVADGDGLSAYDLSDPTNPKKTAFFNTAGWSTWVEVAGGIAYVTTGDANLYLVDVSDPYHLGEIEVVYSLSWPWCYGVALYPGYAVVACEWETVLVDVRDKNNAQVVGKVGGDAKGARQVVVSGDYAWLAVQWGMVGVDLRDPSAPKTVGGFDSDGFSPALAVENASVAYLMDARGLRIVSVADPIHPWEMGTYYVPGFVRRVEVEGDVAYISALWSGMHTLSVRNPNALQPLGFYQVLGGPGGVKIRGGYAYLTAPDHGDLKVLNISNPAHPFFMGSWYTLSRPQDVALSQFGSVAFVVTGRCDLGGLYALDVCNPQEIYQRGFVNTPGAANRVRAAVLNNREYALVLDGDMGIRLIDVNDPWRPFEVGWIEATAGWTYDVAVHGAIAYVADGSAGLKMVDISNPAQPAVLGYIPFEESARAVAIDWPYVFVGRWMGLEVLKFLSPTYAVRAGFYNGSGEVEDIFLGPNGTIYLAMDYGGLVIARHYRQPDPGYHLVLPLLVN